MNYLTEWHCEFTGHILGLSGSVWGHELTRNSPDQLLDFSTVMLSCSGYKHRIGIY